MPQLTGRAGFAVAFLATALSVTWAGTSVLARLTDTVAVGANTFTTPASFCTTRTLTATADTWVFEDSPGENHGTNTYLLVRADGANDKYTLVNFALPTVPDGCSVTSATLNFTTISGTTGRTLQAWRAATSWTESTGWSTKPATTGTAATASSSATVDAVVSWTVTTQVQAMYPSSMFGFVVMDANTGSAIEQRYHSRESTSTTKRPTLVVVIG